jgi:hypothetical protein
VTVLAFCIVAATTGELADAAIIVVIVLPAVVFGQFCVWGIFRRMGSPVWLRRSTMLLPALALAAFLFRETNMFGGKQTAAITAALAGHTPRGLQELHVQESNFPDTVIFAYFRCDPDSLRDILERHPFRRWEYPPDTFSFSEMGFDDLRERPNFRPVVFKRIDLAERGNCTVYADSAFRFAYVTYAVD